MQNMLGLWEQMPWVYGTCAVAASFEIAVSISSSVANPAADAVSDATPAGFPNLSYTARCCEIRISSVPSFPSALVSSATEKY